MQYINILIAIDDNKRVRECIVISKHDKALEIFKKLQIIWGGNNVALCCRLIDDIPDNILEYAGAKI
jgi:hypothetical protein